MTGRVTTSKSPSSVLTPDCLCCARESQVRASANGGEMKRISLISLAMLVLLACSALAQDVRYNFDKTADFSKFKTYEWVTLKDAATLDDITEKNIKDAVDRQLATKGLTKVTSDQADLYIGMQAAVGQDKQFTSYSSGWGYGPGWYGAGWYGPGGSTVTTGQTSTIYTGQLTLDVYDASKHDLVWRGVVSKTIDPKAKPEKQQKNLDKSVAKLLKNYPPPPPKS
jgi:hypothetical protein